jgi:HlyD family secretion protein
MTVFLSESTAGRLPIGSDARVVLDASPNAPLPAKVSFVADEAQFTPKAVETTDERQKLVFRVKVRLDAEVVRREEANVKAGAPGIAYVSTQSVATWPEALQVSTARR